MKKKYIGWGIFRKSDGALMDDSNNGAYGRSEPAYLYPIFKTRKDAVIYKRRAYGRWSNGIVKILKVFLTPKT